MHPDNKEKCMRACLGIVAHGLLLAMTVAFWSSATLEYEDPFGKVSIVTTPIHIVSLCLYGVGMLCWLFFVGVVAFTPLNRKHLLNLLACIVFWPYMAPFWLLLIVAVPMLVKKSDDPNRTRLSLFWALATLNPSP